MKFYSIIYSLKKWDEDFKETSGYYFESEQEAKEYLISSGFREKAWEWIKDDLKGEKYLSITAGIIEQEFYKYNKEVDSFEY